MSARPSISSARTLVLAGITALLLLSLAWELWLAPLRPGGSLLALKALPLAAALPALARGRLRAYQWWSMLILLYLCEGVVRGMSDATATGRALGWIEAVLAAVVYGAILAHVRGLQRASRAPAP